jgi:hypothetical protein
MRFPKTPRLPKLSELSKLEIALLTTIAVTLGTGLGVIIIYFIAKAAAPPSRH